MSPTEPTPCPQAQKAKELALTTTVFDAEVVERNAKEVLAALGVAEDTHVSWKIGDSPYRIRHVDTQPAITGFFSTEGGMVTLSFSPLKNGQNTVQVCFNALDGYEYEGLHAFQVTQTRNANNDMPIATILSGHTHQQSPFELACYYHDEPPVMCIDGDYPQAQGFAEVRQQLPKSDSLALPLALLAQVAGMQQK
jgi:hypothetical protein